MPTNSIDNLLDQLDQNKTTFDNGAASRLESVLSKLQRVQFEDVESLIRFHEILMFVRAHPHNRRILRLTERALSAFVSRVNKLRKSDIDTTAFDYIEYSGIAGTSITGHFSYDIARWLCDRFGSNVQIDWTRHERGERLGSTLPRFTPLLEEESFVEANIPYLKWIKSARPKGKTDLQWLIEGFTSLTLTNREKGELYDSLELWLKWDLGTTSASRTRNIRPVREVYFHSGPFIPRRDVDLRREVSRPIRMQRLSSRDGLAAIDMLRTTTTVRYRELYGITHGDPRLVRRIDVGRGVEIFLWGLPPERRLPLRAYHLGFTLKNGVPINYIEGMSLCGRMEVGFNTFYTFRDGESAWVYGQVLRVLREAGAAECFSIDPYQLGFHNEEAIESGAFWFYCKLGFHLTRPDLKKILTREEQKISTGKGYRTSASTLRRLAEENVLFEVDPNRTGEWDRFKVRNLGLAVQRRMAKGFNGDAASIRAASSREVTKALGVNRTDFSELELRAFDNIALILGLIPDLKHWQKDERQAVVDIVRAKVGLDEALYSRLLQGHRRLRAAISRIASKV